MDIPNAESIIDGVPIAYTTKDFEFAATLLALDHPRIYLGQLEPFKHSYARQSGKDTRYVMIMLLEDTEEFSANDTVDVLKKLREQYDNRQLKIEPTALFGAQRRLRARMHDEDRRRGVNFASQKRGDKHERR